MLRRLPIYLICAVLLFSLLSPVSAPVVRGAPDSSYYIPFIASPISAPILKFQRLGCLAWGCETGWYSSPALVDVDADGKLDIIASASSVWALDGEDGRQIWSAPSPGGNGRTWPGIVVADLDKDGAAEIVTANGNGYLTVYRLNGTVKWQARPTTSELRGLLAVDLDNDGSSLELVVTAANSNKLSTWVYNTAGGLAVRPGWPQLSGTIGYAAGVYNANAAAANLDLADARLELIVPTDVHYIAGYKPDGSLLPANSSEYPGRTTWGQVGVWENLAVEKRGWGECTPGFPRSENYRPNFADSPATIADLNQDGQREVIVAGSVYDCSIGGYPPQYTGPFIFNKDRTRFNSGGYDWRTSPVDTGAPLSIEWNVIQTAEPNPVVADLDNDGKLEILYSSFDGKVHAFWLDKTEHGAWPFKVHNPAEGVIRFASEPVVADLDGIGGAEVIFTSWTQNGSNKTGRLHILNAQGMVLQEVDLPPAFSGDYNGALAAPTLGNVDGDLDLEVIINSINSGVLVYDLPHTSGAHILWGTGRGSFLRDGAR
jgi:outer membrane protein assembly factor BamB